MKKFTCLLLLLMLVATIPMSAIAESKSYIDFVSLGELRKQALEGWHQTYNVNGKEVITNADINWMPETDLCPIIKIVRHNVDESLLDKYRGKGNIVMYSPKSYSASIQVDADMKTWFINGFNRNGNYVLHREKSFKHGEIPTEIPEGLDVNYQKLIDIFNSHITPLEGTTFDDYWVEELQLEDVLLSLKGSKPATKTGSWSLWLWRIFQGIPIGSAWEGPYGYNVFNYYGDTSYNFNAHPIVEVGNVYDDVPLLSFNSIKAALEQQINAGTLHSVDEMRFCYLPFLNKGGANEPWVLCPVWRILGGYSEDKNVKNTLPYIDENGEQCCPMEYYYYYYNAQTGEMLRTAPMLGDHMNPIVEPNILTWNDVGIKK